MADRLVRLGRPGGQGRRRREQPVARPVRPGAVRTRRPFAEDGTVRLVYAGALTPTYEVDVAVEAVARAASRRARSCASASTSTAGAMPRSRWPAGARELGVDDARHVPRPDPDRGCAGGDRPGRHRPRPDPARPVHRRQPLDEGLRVRGDGQAGRRVAPADGRGDVPAGHGRRRTSRATPRGWPRRSTRSSTIRCAREAAIERTATIVAESVVGAGGGGVRSSLVGSAGRRSGRPVTAAGRGPSAPGTVRYRTRPTGSIHPCCRTASPHDLPSQARRQLAPPPDARRPEPAEPLPQHRLRHRRRQRRPHPRRRRRSSATTASTSRPRRRSVARRSRGTTSRIAAAIEVWRLQQQQARINAALDAGRLTSAQAQPQIQSLQQPGARRRRSPRSSSRSSSTARSRRTSPPSWAITVTPEQIDAKIVEESTTPEQRHAWMIAVQPEVGRRQDRPDRRPEGRRPRRSPKRHWPTSRPAARSGRTSRSPSRPTPRPRPAATSAGSTRTRWRIRSGSTRSSPRSRTSRPR